MTDILVIANVGQYNHRIYRSLKYLGADARLVQNTITLEQVREEAPRAIEFTAALYSIGLPPEILGSSALSGGDLGFVRDVYVNFEADLRDSLRYLNRDSLVLLPRKLRAKFKDLPVDFEVDGEYREITDQVIDALKKNRKGALGEYVLRAAHRGLQEEDRQREDSALRGCGGPRGYDRGRGDILCYTVSPSGPGWGG